MLLALLKGGDRRSIGRAEEVAVLVTRNRKLFPELMSGLWSEEKIVRMRAADAIEKVTRENSEPLVPYKKELLGLMTQAEQQEVRWHLAAMVPRLQLSERERQLAASCFQRYLEDRSSIVRTFALQGLPDLAEHDPAMRREVLDLLRAASRDGTAAMRARSRKLLGKLEGKEWAS